MASGPRRTGAPSGSPAASARLRLRGIKEMPGAHDEEVAAIFRDIRQASGLNQGETARRLGTSERTVAALEDGALLALPEWPETSRIVLAYASMLNLDARPILRRLYQQLVPQGPMRESGGESPAGALRADARQSGSSERGPPRRRGVGRVLKWLLVLVMVSGAAYGGFQLQQRPQLINSMIDRLPDPLPRLARAGLELLKSVTDSVGGGFDPRSRKSDKLTDGVQSGRGR